MDTNEMALKLTLAAMDKGLIIFAKQKENSACSFNELGEANALNAKLITNFANAVIEGLTKAKPV